MVTGLPRQQSAKVLQLNACKLIQCTRAAIFGVNAKPHGESTFMDMCRKMNADNSGNERADFLRKRSLALSLFNTGPGGAGVVATRAHKLP